MAAMQGLSGFERTISRRLESSAAAFYGLMLQHHQQQQQQQHPHLQPSKQQQQLAADATGMRPAIADKTGISTSPTLPEPSSSENDVGADRKRKSSTADDDVTDDIQTKPPVAAPPPPQPSPTTTEEEANICFDVGCRPSPPAIASAGAAIISFSISRILGNDDSRPQHQRPAHSIDWASVPWSLQHAERIRPLRDVKLEQSDNIKEMDSVDLTPDSCCLDEDEEGDDDEEEEDDQSGDVQDCDSEKDCSRLMREAGESERIGAEFNDVKLGDPAGADDCGEAMERLAWLQCTRYKPPKLPRSKKLRDGIKKRKLGRNPRVPFTQHQVAVLEQKFRRTHYLSSVDVAELSSALNLTENRVKIWFQNRRARERRNKDTCPGLQTVVAASSVVVDPRHVGSAVQLLPTTTGVDHDSSHRRLSSEVDDARSDNCPSPPSPPPPPPSSTGAFYLDPTGRRAPISAAAYVVDKSYASGMYPFPGSDPRFLHAVVGAAGRGGPAGIGASLSASAFQAAAAAATTWSMRGPPQQLPVAMRMPAAADLLAQLSTNFAAARRLSAFSPVGFLR